MMMPDDALETLRGFDAILLGAIGDPRVPDHVSLWGLLQRPADPAARGHRLPAGRAVARGSGHRASTPGSEAAVILGRREPAGCG